MTITFLDLYNTAASQEWSMYDNDAVSDDEFEKSLVLSLNKAAAEIIYSYPFNFRERTHVIITVPGVQSYAVPPGIILKDSNENYCIKLGSKPLKLLKNLPDKKSGIPEGFYIQGSKIILSPVPAERCIITVSCVTLAIGEDKDGNEIYALEDEDDTISVPEHLEGLLKNAIISRTMLNSIASESDENYSAYKKQSETAYRLLIKYSKGVSLDKNIKI